MMNEESRNMLRKITRGVRFVSQSIRLMIGMPEYSTYLEHMRKAHPDRPAMSYAEFFRERQEARYGGKISRCC
jgi:uncharacterized short protein YbdD (DUF466 family)